MKSVLVLEDHPETRQWLVEMSQAVFIDTDVRQAASLAQANQLLNESSFDLALIDLNLPDGTGTDFIKVLKQQSPHTYIVVATIFDDDTHLFPALQAGANGYLLKDLANEDFISSLSGIIKGEPPISPAIAQKLISHFNRPPSIPVADPDTEQLSKRETEILKLIARGMNRKQVSETLHISPHTVASHLKKIYNKLNVSSRAEATLEALRLGLVDSHK